MSNLININYALDGNLSVTYNVLVSKEATVADILEVINIKHEKSYSNFIYKQSAINKDHNIIEYFNLDPKYVFIITNDSISPEKHEIESISETDESFQFLFTGCDKEMLLNGIDVKLNMNMNPDECKNRLMKYIQNKISMNEKKLIIYLSGGLRFVSGTLGDFYLSKEISPCKRICGVVIRNIPTDLEDICIDPYVAHDKIHMMMISPLCDSTKRGLSDIACLLGYLMKSVNNVSTFVRKISYVICFSPFIVSLNKFVSKTRLQKYDTVNVCSTLFTFFRAYLPTSIPDNRVFEFGLRLCNLVLNIDNSPLNLPIMEISSIDCEKFSFLSKTCHLTQNNFIWRIELLENEYKDFERIEFDQPSMNEIENSYELNSKLNPVPPLSVHDAQDCCIVKGKDQEYLYVIKTPIKQCNAHEMIDILHPMVGQIESKDLEIFAKSQEDIETNDIGTYIDINKVKQIVMINVDSSESMLYDMDGSKIKSDEKESCIGIAFQCLTSFVNKLFGFHIPSIFGIVDFNNTVTYSCPLTVFCDKFDEELFKIEPRGKRNLWDSLALSYNEIFKYRKDIYGNEIFKNSISRILLVSSGDDNESTAKVEDVVKELLKNKIIVDSIIINNTHESNCEMICAVSHITGGLSFIFNEISDILLLFDNILFIDYEQRYIDQKPLIPGDISSIPSHIKIEQITEEFMLKIKENSKFDQKVLSKKQVDFLSNHRLSTPIYACANLRNVDIEESCVNCISQLK